MKWYKKLVICLSLVCVLAFSLVIPSFAMSNGNLAQPQVYPYGIPDSVTLRSASNYLTSFNIEKGFYQLSGAQKSYIINGSGTTYYASALVSRQYINGEVQVVLNGANNAIIPNSPFYDNSSGYPLGKSYGNNPVIADNKEIGVPMVSNAIELKWNERYINVDSIDNDDTYLNFDVVYYLPIYESNISNGATVFNSFNAPTLDYKGTYIATNGQYNTKSIRYYGEKISYTFNNNYFVNSIDGVPTATQNVSTMCITVRYSCLPSVAQFPNIQLIENNENGIKPYTARVLDESMVLYLPSGNILGVSNSGGSGYVVSLTASVIDENAHKKIIQSYTDINITNDFNAPMLDWLFDTVGGVLSVELFGFISIGGLLAICISLGVSLMVLKIFAGG